MRITTLLLFLGCLQLSAAGFSQTVTLFAKRQPLAEVLNAIREQTGFYALLNQDMARQARLVTVQLSDTPLSEALFTIFKDQPFDYQIDDRMIIVERKPRNDSGNLLLKQQPITGGVFDEEGKPLSGATVSTVNNGRTWTITDKAGQFSILGSIGDSLLISFIGYNNQLAVVKNYHMPAIQLTKNTIKIDEVTIHTGMFERKQESFTGAASTFSGAQLKAIGNKNILESLRSLDPSFIRIENNLTGSNPNQLPTFEIRGRTSINTSDLNNQFNADPNQPLFILDGFESTLEAIYNLDMNRVASVTILKDAASTAIYGAKASNGVVVVETKKPVPGKLLVSYTGDFSLDIPDLSSYNLMDAAEKLEFERLAGRYSQGALDESWRSEENYQGKLTAVRSGVNTYWLSEPVHLGVTNRHSVRVSGGNSDLLLDAGLAYGNQEGIMKGSVKNNWSGNVNVTYRKNKLNINNMLTLSGLKGTESPYGSFSNFANADPYYKKRLDDGSIPKYLDPLYDSTAVNPLYNASLYSIDNNSQFSLTNNTQVIYSITRALRLQGGLQLSKGNSTSIQFVPPDNSAFDGVDARQKGRYSNNRLENTAYNGNIMLTYGETFGKHQVNMNVRADMQNTSSNTVGFSAVGFPYGTNGNPLYAYGFTPYSTPNAAFTRSRSLGFLASANYSFDQRYLLDAVYRLDGASVFGSEKLYKPFVSGGLGWNINQETFMKNHKWINLLKLRGDIGYTGNENLGQFSSVSTYVFQSGNTNNFGQGLTLASLGNPGLDWQKTLQASYGLDFSIWYGRVSGSIEYFRKKTDPLAVPANQVLPASVGANSNYVLNIGALTTKGWNFNLRLTPFSNPLKGIFWNIGIMGSNYTSVYSGLEDNLSAWNESELESNGLARYYDGYSPDDLWAVVSLGVDPATGQELFQKLDGSTTFNYDPKDIVRVGNTRPKVEGTINSSFTYKEFTLGAVLRYRIGGDVMNGALYNKVENISSASIRNNQDKRALYDRWQEPGDIAQFIAISSSRISPMSTRFIQTDTHLIGESFSLSWRSYDDWIKKYKLQSFSINFYLNDIFRMERIRTERGIDYPYARSASFSINATF